MRAVILHHSGYLEDHFDLLIEQEPGVERVWTWRLSSHPITAATRIERLPDHRRMYLDYEGLVSRGRGRVARVWSGAIELISADPIEVRGLLATPADMILPGLPKS